jgi:iron complex transport system ATP-binding protein
VIGAGAPVLEVAGVWFAYDAARRPARERFQLADVTFDARAGEILAVIGPNSAGKTTLVRLVSKVVDPLRGEIRLDGRGLSALARWEIARIAAVVPQELPEAFPFNVDEMVLMGRYPHSPGTVFESEADRAVCREAMAATGVLEVARRPLAELSGGERQRAVLARALAQQPRLLLLDEPTAHLDLRHQAEAVALLRRLSRESGVTVVLVSHDLNLVAEVADRVLLLHAGRVERLGAPEDVLDESILSRVYGCTIEVDKHPTTRRPMVRLAWDAPRSRA